MTTYVLAPRARLDLLEIVEYLMDNADIDVADRVADEFEAAFKRLAETPGIGHQRPDETTLDVLFYSGVYNYLIIYEPDATPLNIVRILHGARDLPPLLH